MDTALAGIDDQLPSHQPTLDIDAIVMRIVKTETNSLLLNLKKKENLLDQRLQDINNLQESFTWLETKFNLTVETIHTELHVLQTGLTEQTQRTTDHLQRIESHCTDIEHKIDITDFESLQTQIINIQAHTNNQILKLKNKTKTYVKQTDQCCWRPYQSLGFCIIL